MDGLDHVVTSCTMISQQVQTIFQVTNVWDRVKGSPDGQAQGSVCETQVRLTNSSLELKSTLLWTIYTKSLTHKESYQMERS